MTVSNGFKRIVALVLIPALTADPLLASISGSHLSPRSIHSLSSLALMAQQAVNEPGLPYLNSEAPHPKWVIFGSLSRRFARSGNVRATPDRIGHSGEGAPKDLLSQRRKDLLAIVGGDKAALDNLLASNEAATHVSFETLVRENHVPNEARSGHPSPIEQPEAFLMMGGSGGNFFTGVLPEIVQTTPPMRDIRLNSIVGLSPWDDGGGSRKAAIMFEPLIGPMPSPGDEVNVMAGVTSPHKRFVLRYRTKTEEGGSLKAKLIEVLSQAYHGVNAAGEPIPELQNTPIDADWVTFSHHLLRIAELLDRDFIDTGDVVIAGNSMGNFINIGAKLLFGAYSKETKTIDHELYSKANQFLCEILNIPDIHVAPVSFTPGTLYAVLESPSIRIGDHDLVLNQDNIARERVELSKVDVRLSRTPEGFVSFTIHGETAVIAEEFGRVIVRHSQNLGIGDAHGPESQTVLKITNAAGDERKVILNTNGQGQDVQVGDVTIHIKGRLVIEQTWITESLNFAPVVDMGLINGNIPSANPEYVDLLKRTRDVVVMGPGSLITSLMPELLSPDIVATLVQRRREGHPTVFVFNPFKDNETVDFTFERLRNLVEKVSGHRFEELYSHVVINDMAGIVRLAIHSKDEAKEQAALHLLDLMDEMKTIGSIHEERTETSASVLAKKSRGPLGVNAVEAEELRRFLNTGRIPDTYELSEIRDFKREMARRGVSVIEKPLATVIQREKRVAGGLASEAAVGYSRAALGEVLDGILVDAVKSMPIYKKLLRSFGNDDNILLMEIRHMMGLYPTWTLKDVLQKMHSWWIERIWPAGTNILTPDMARGMNFPKVIIANAAFTLTWLNGEHRPMDMEPRLVKALNEYLSRGGALIIMSGFGREVLEQHFGRLIEPSLRQRVIIAPSTGAEAYGYDDAGNLVETPYYSWRARLKGDVRSRWYAVAKRVYNEFELGEPLLSLSGQMIDGPVPLDMREAQVTFETAGRVNLQPAIAERLNSRLRERGLADYQLSRTSGGYWDIREAISRRLENLLTAEKLPISIHPRLIGTGALNMSFQTPLEGLRTLQTMGVIEEAAGRKVQDNDILFLGRNPEDLVEAFPGALYVAFQIQKPPEDLPAGLKVYQGAPGPQGVAELIENILVNPSNPVRDDANTAFGFHLNYTSREHNTVNQQIQAARSGARVHAMTGERLDHLRQRAALLLQSSEVSLDSALLAKAEQAVQTASVHLVQPKVNGPPALYSRHNVWKKFISVPLILVLSLFRFVPAITSLQENLRRWPIAFQIAHVGVAYNQIILSEPYLQLSDEELSVLLAHEAVGLASKQMAHEKGHTWTRVMEQTANRAVRILERTYAPQLNDHVWDIFFGRHFKDRIGHSAEGAAAKKDEVLLGKPLGETDGVIDTSLLEKVRALLGVEDLVGSQRLPEDEQAAIERVHRAIENLHRQLKAERLDLATVDQETFNKHFAVAPVIMAAGSSKRFSAVLHKAFARAGLQKTSIGYTIQGSYTSPGRKPILVVGDKLLGSLVKDSLLSAQYDQKQHMFIVNTEKLDLKPGVLTPIKPEDLDPEKVQKYLGCQPDQISLAYLQEKRDRGAGYGVTFIKAMASYGSNIPYMYPAWGETPTAALPTRSNASFITYLESLGSNNDVIVGAQSAPNGLEDKEHLFFNAKEGRILSLTTWEQVPHLKPMQNPGDSSGWVDRTQEQLADQQLALQQELEDLPRGNSFLRSRAIQGLRLKYPTFAISDEGVVFTQEALEEVHADLQRWDKLSAVRQGYIRRHFGVREDANGDKKLLISANVAVFRTRVAGHIIGRIQELERQGHFDEPYEFNNDRRQVNVFYSVDVKTRETQTNPWNIVRLIADAALGVNRPLLTGCAYVGEAPARIQSPRSFLAFAKEVPTWRHQKLTALTPDEVKEWGIIRENLTKNRTAQAFARLKLLSEDPNAWKFRHVLQHLLVDSSHATWQIALLGVLSDLMTASPTTIPVTSSISPRGPPEKSEMRIGIIEHAVAEGIDSGDIAAPAELLGRDPTYDRGILKLRKTLVTLSGGRSDYLIERLVQICLEQLESDIVDLNQILPMRAGYDSETPTPSKYTMAITGGTSMRTLWAEAFREAGLSRDDLDVTSVVGIVDDGGSSYKIVTVLMNAFFGIFPPPGDQVNAMTGFVSQDKIPYLLGDEGRFSLNSRASTFAKAIVGPIEQALLDRTITFGSDYFYFLRVLMSAVKMVDDINSEIAVRGDGLSRPQPLPIAQSIRNLVGLGFLKAVGRFFLSAIRHSLSEPAVVTSQRGKQEDSYETAFREMTRALGAKNFTSLVASYDPKTLYGMYEGYTTYIRQVHKPALTNFLSTNRLLPQEIDFATPKGIQLVTALCELNQPDQQAVLQTLNAYHGYRWQPSKSDVAKAKEIADWLKKNSILSVVVLEPQSDKSIRVMNPHAESEDRMNRVLHPGERVTAEDLGFGPAVPVIFSNRDGEIQIICEKEEWTLDESDINHVRLVDSQHRKKDRPLATDGTGRSKSEEGNSESSTPLLSASDGQLQIYIANRLIKTQTHITETINFSKLLRIGFLDKLGLEGRVPATPLHQAPNHPYLDQINAMEAGSVILVGPGSLFTSILPHFLVEGVPEALADAKARGVHVVFMMNAVLDNETNRYTPIDTFERIQETAGRKMDQMFSYVIGAQYESEQDFLDRTPPQLRTELYDILHPFILPKIRTGDQSAVSEDAKKSRGPAYLTESDITAISDRWPTLIVKIMPHALALKPIESRKTADKGKGKQEYRLLYEQKAVAAAIKEIFYLDQAEQVEPAPSSAKGFGLTYSPLEHDLVNTELANAFAESRATDMSRDIRIQHARELALQFIGQSSVQPEGESLEKIRNVLASVHVYSIEPQPHAPPALFTRIWPLRRFLVLPLLALLSLVSFIPPAAAVSQDLKIWSTGFQVAHFSTSRNQINISAPYINALSPAELAALLIHESIGITVKRDAFTRGQAWTAQLEAYANQWANRVEKQLAPTLDRTLRAVFRSKMYDIQPLSQTKNHQQTISEQEAATSA